MTTEPIHPRTLLQWGLALVLVVAVAAVVAQLRRSAPYEPPDFVVEAAQDPDDPAADIVTCERSLPEVPTVPEDVEEVTPVGRVTSSEVLECPAAFDGQVVVYIGEVVGDVLRRRGGAWVLMNDDEYALETGPLRSHGQPRGYNSGMSVWLDGDLRDLVDVTGGPERRGDILVVRGVVHRADPDDGGGLTIRAFAAEVAVEGQSLSVPVHRAQVVVAVLLGLAALVLFVVERRSRRVR